MKILKCTLCLFLLCLVFVACKKDKGMPTVTDVDGNVYHTVKIGTQTWMVENLKTTKFNDKSPITNITDNTAWKDALGAAYCWYNNDLSYKTDYGALYNWVAVNTGNLAPKGWHVATKTDWETLINFIGGSTMADKLREKGTTHWTVSNDDATDEYGFKLLPEGGRQSATGVFDGNEGVATHIWTGFSPSAGIATALVTSSNSNDLDLPAYNQRSGFPVRCVKN